MFTLLVCLAVVCVALAVVALTFGVDLQPATTSFLRRLRPRRSEAGVVTVDGAPVPPRAPDGEPPASPHRPPRRGLRRRRAPPATSGGLSVTWERARPPLWRRLVSALGMVLLTAGVGGLAAVAIGAVVGLIALAVRSAVGGG